MSKRLTSADIEDGKVEYDAATNSTTTYKKIKNGYEVTTTTALPNGTKKSQTKTFYDPVPVELDGSCDLNEAKKRALQSAYGVQLTSADIEDGKVEYDAATNTTTTYKKIKNGYEVIKTTKMANGTTKSQTQTFYDPVPVDDSVDDTDLSSTQVAKKKSDTKRTVDKSDKNQRIEETRSVMQKTEISGKSTKTSKRSNIMEQQSIESVTCQEDMMSVTSKDKTDKKKKLALPTEPLTVPEFEESPGGKTTVTTRKVPGGTEYTYTTVFEDGHIEIAIKTVFKEKVVEMTEEEIQEYHKQLKEAQKNKDISKPKKLPSESGTKKIIPSENANEMTTVETKKISGGTEYHYTTVSLDGTVKKSSKTAYDPVVMVTDEEQEEEEIIEEYEEEIIQPGEPIVTTTKSIKELDSTETKVSRGVYSKETNYQKKEKKSTRKVYTSEAVNA